jgi:hypothetical protein
VKLKRGSYLNKFRRNYYAGSYCRSQIACFNRLLAQVRGLSGIGNQMANVFFNISQRADQIHPNDNATFKKLQERWDGTKREVGL